MIVAYTGVPGSYKTHDGVKQMISFMRESKNLSLGLPANAKVGTPVKKVSKTEQMPRLRHVYTNVRGFGCAEYREILKAITGWNEDDCLEFLHSCTDAELKAHFGTIAKFDVLDEDDSSKKRISKGQVVGCTFQRNSVICVDEVHTLFNCRDFQDDSNRAFTYYGTYHRHENSHVLLISHEMEKVDRQIRDLVGISYYFEQVLFLGKKGKDSYIRHMYRGVETKGKAVHKERFSIDQGVINSYMTTKTGDVDNFEFVKTPNMLFKSPLLWCIPVVLVLSLVCLQRAIGGNGLIGQFMHPGLNSKVAAVSAARPGAVPPLRKSSVAVVPAPAPVYAPLSSSRGSGAVPAAPVAVSAVPASPGRAIVGVINLDGKFYILRADGSREQGDLKSHKQLLMLCKE